MSIIWTEDTKFFLHQEAKSVDDTGIEPVTYIPTCPISRISYLVQSLHEYAVSSTILIPEMAFFVNF